MRRSLVVALLSSVCAVSPSVPAVAQPIQAVAAIAYPQTRCMDLVETQFGVPVADPNGAPHLIRIETRAGHGSGKPTTKIIEEAFDVMAFLGHFTGLDF